MRHRGDCDVCLKKDCKISDKYIKKLAADIVSGKKIKPCRKWK